MQRAGAVAPIPLARAAFAWGAPPLARARAALAGWAYVERGRFALWLPLAMAAGTIAYLRLRAEPAPWIGPVCCVAAAVLAVLLWRRPVARGAAAGLLAAALGFAAGQGATGRAAPLLDVPRRAVTVSGTVAAVELLPQAADSQPGRRITITRPVLEGPDGAAPPAARSVRIRLRRDDAAPVAAGDQVQVRALLSPPSPPAYPGAWDLRRDAFFAGLGAYGFALRPATVQAAAVRPGWPALLQRLRETVVGRVGAVLYGADAAVAITLLTGNPSGVDEADKAAFRDSGLAHLLAIAGLHIGIVMGLVFGTTRLILAAWEHAALHWPIKALAALASLAAGAGYLALTGAHVPIVRSFVMATLFTVAVLAGRRALSLRGWALAMAALLALSPNAVLGVSFQMSFSAVLALIAGFDALRPWLTRLRGQGGVFRHGMATLAALALTSALAGTASAPFAAYHFGHIQLYFVLANMAAVPLTAFWVLPLGIAALALMPLHLEALALVPMGWGTSLLLLIARGAAALPSATLAVPAIPGAGLVLVALGLAWLGLWRTRVRLAGAAVLAAGLLSPLCVAVPDLLVSADARLIGLRTQGGVLVQAVRGSQRFEQDAWVQYWATGAAGRLPDVGAAADGAVACDAAGCRWSAPGGLVMLARREPDPSACAAALIVSAAPVRLRCPVPVPTIDRFSVWRDGAYSAWLSPGGVHVLTDRMVTGDRPWVPARATSRGLGGLKLAPLDTPGDAASR